MFTANEAGMLTHEDTFPLVPLATLLERLRAGRRLCL